ncbi:MAG TPA: choice-of-anchor tandem repeat GloVer-containing protein [Rhizomicrobium sp.]|jgi:hypothetical protein|nr:choice-of-anchor tandem repeat GloVer-containing protein [Rhizomicrobium sp.]
MRYRLQRISGVCLAVAVLPFLWAESLARDSETVLHAFEYDSDGGFPFAGPTMDSKGNLYGVADFGGAFDGVCCGTVYELMPTQKGGWKYSVIYTFKGNILGEAPVGGLILDEAGNLYGTAQIGGRVLGCGIVYELSPNAKGEWKKTDLHAFTHPDAPHYDGCTPSSYLVFDQTGNLYGTTQLGGGNEYDGQECGETNWGCGTVFKLAPQENGKWKETLIHRFPERSGDGQEPYAGLVFDHSGNLWGTTIDGTDYSTFGTAFELTPDANGKWKESAVFDFTGNSTGYGPYAGLVADAENNIYGATYYGGNGAGLIFKLTPGKGGRITENVIHAFETCNETECPDGIGPFGGLTMDSNGHLYGTATQGGAQGTFCNPPGEDIEVGCGVVFELAPAGNNNWNYSILYAFPGGTQGSYLLDDRLSVAAGGNIFGTAFVGGDVGQNSVCPEEVILEPGCGVVFQLTP